MQKFNKDIVIIIVKLILKPELATYLSMLFHSFRLCVILATKTINRPLYKNHMFLYSIYPN